MQNEINSFRHYIDASIRKHKPHAHGTKGTLSYVGDYLKSYGEKLADCVEDLTVKSNEILGKFDGDKVALRGELVKEIQDVTGKFKKAHWS
jgi:hypothetical protein